MLLQTNNCLRFRNVWDFPVTGYNSLSNYGIKATIFYVYIYVCIPTILYLLFENKEDPVWTT